MLVGTVSSSAVEAELAFNIRMNVDAFLTKLTFGEVGAIFLRVEVGTFLVSVVAIREMPASNLLFITFMSFFMMFYCISTSDVVFMLRKVDD